MKRITLGAVDYGLAFGIDRAQRSLLEAGRLSAVGCLVSADLWPREFKPLRETIDESAGHALVGLTIALSGPFVTPCSKRAHDVFGVEFPSRGWMRRRAFFRMLPDGLIVEEIIAQIDRFIDYFGAVPDFLTMRDGLMRSRPIARLVITALEQRALPQAPYLVSPFLDGWRARRFENFAHKAGYPVLPRGPSLPETIDKDTLHQTLHRHFDGLTDMTFVTCMPGEADDRLRRRESQHQVATRVCHLNVLRSGEFFRTLDQKDVFLF